MSIKDITPTEPQDTGLVSAGAKNIRDVSGDITESFPGFASAGGTDDIQNSNGSEVDTAVAQAGTAVQAFGTDATERTASGDPLRITPADNDYTIDNIDDSGASNSVAQGERNFLSDADKTKLDGYPEAADIVEVTDSVGVLADVDVSGVQDGDVLKWDGSDFVPRAHSRLVGTLSNSGSTELGETTSIPTDAVRIEIDIESISLNGDGIVRVELGDSTGYASSSAGSRGFGRDAFSGGNLAWAGNGPGEILDKIFVDEEYSGLVVLQKRDGTNRWFLTSLVGCTDGTRNTIWRAAGFIGNSGEAVDRLRITSSLGNFDNGAAYVRVYQ